MGIDSQQRVMNLNWHVGRMKYNTSLSNLLLKVFMTFTD